MNKNNLIRLGAECQKRFEMLENFEIYEADPKPAGINDYLTDNIAIDGGVLEHVTFEKLVFEDLEYVRVGYARMANVLVIKEAQEIGKEWISVKDRLPEFEGIVWVKRLTEKWPELAFYRDYEGHPEDAFQDPLAVNDGEGLNQEYYLDVTHWMDLIEPEP
jgi:hypothetical protein